ncbi:MAG: tRNA-intron lyase [Nanoarchaeota archaeon]
MITAYLSGNSASSTSELAFSLVEKSNLGEKHNSKITYSLFETLYLMEQRKLELFEKTKQISQDTLAKKAKKADKNFQTKYLVFSDLRSKGYIVKTALKFGADFRVYPKGSSPGKEHATWLVFPVQEHQTLSWHEFSAKNRVATSTKKKLLLAIVDDEHDVLYYEVRWLRP